MEWNILGTSDFLQAIWLYLTSLVSFSGAYWVTQGEGKKAIFVEEGSHVTQDMKEAGQGITLRD